jgi:hypothetical protein
MLAYFLSRINDTMQETSLAALPSGGIDHACTKYWTVWPELSFADSEFSQRPLLEVRIVRNRTSLAPDPHLLYVSYHTPFFAPLSTIFYYSRYPLKNAAFLRRHPLSTTYLSNQSYRTFSSNNNRVVVLPLILTVLIITSNSYGYARCSTLTECSVPDWCHSAVVCTCCVLV